MSAIQKSIFEIVNRQKAKYSALFSLFGIAGGQEIDRTFVEFIIYPLTMIAFNLEVFLMFYSLTAS